MVYQCGNRDGDSEICNVTVTKCCVSEVEVYLQLSEVPCVHEITYWFDYVRIVAGYGCGAVFDVSYESTQVLIHCQPSQNYIVYSTTPFLLLVNIFTTPRGCPIIGGADVTPVLLTMSALLITVLVVGYNSYI